MNFYLIFIAIIFLQEVPLKPKGEFEIKLDYQFKSRPVGDNNTVQLGEAPGRYDQRTGAGVLPYLILNIKLLALPDEKMRIQISNNLQNRPYYKRVTVNEVLELDLGFTDDMIDRVKAHEYILTFVNDDKKPVDRIVIGVEEDGSFIVNGEKRGKF